MNDNRNNIDSERNKEDLSPWMESYTQESGKVALEMGEADLLETFIMEKAALIASSEFEKRLEYIIDLDELNIDKLIKILKESGFNEMALTKIGKDEDWEKYQLPFAAWLKRDFGRGHHIFKVII